MTVKISEEKLKALVKESVKEVLRSEIMRLRALALPEVSEKEQKDIERRYGKPSRRTSKSYTLRV